MPAGPLLAIRADASREGGAGHIMRTLALAQEWISRGGTCIYLSRTLPTAIKERLDEEGCQIQSLSSDDADEIASCLEKLAARWLIIDHYELGRDFQRKLRLPAKTKLGVISDQGINDFFEPEMVIHANVSSAADYTEAPKHTTILPGADYVLLRKELLLARKKSPVSTAKNILISMGGSDPQEAGYIIASALIDSGILDDRICRLLLGPAYPDHGKAHSLSHPAIELVHSPPNMAGHYVWADAAICSPSVTSLELAHIGVPMAVCLTAENQSLVAKALIDETAALLVGNFLGEPSIKTDILSLLLNDSETRLALSKRASSMIDGHGASRICDQMELPMLQLRDADSGDTEILWEWTNDPATRAASFNSKPIPWKNHIAWLTKQFDSEDTILLMIESTQGVQFGVVRFNINAESQGESIISISLAAESRGRGLAPIILSMCVDYFFRKYPDQIITAWIKPENKASHQTFIRANFENYPSPNYPDRVRMRLNFKPS